MMRFLLLILWAVWPATAFADDLAVPSVWENQSGSVLFLDTMDDEGRLTGRYVNGAAGYSCQGIEYDVEGRVFEPLITFNVIWRAEAETCHTITSWTGAIEGDVIATEWALVRWVAPDPVSGEGGLGRYAGESRFVRRD
ncbi:MAG: hypothetical protein GC188_13485 [Alphaproteobacteria bacterium]|nr:hypothetical protein [Alphaproteobacteria bacterium]